MFKSVHDFILLLEQLGVEFDIGWIHHTKSLANMPVIREVSSVLHATFKHHIAELNLLAGPDLQFKQLVTALLEVNR